MLKFGNKEFRNLQEQVLKNMQNIANIKEGTAVLSEFGIKVVGEVDALADLPSVIDYKAAHEDWEYGDAFAIGTEAPYTLVILTRANDEITADHWFDIGEFPAPGPQGPAGPQGEVGPQGQTGDTGPAGDDAGFGSILATAQTLPAGSSATATVTASGPNTAKEFSFTFGIPRGADGGNATWGNIQGTLSDQTDLDNALDAKQDTLVSGTNIKTINSQSIVGSGNIEINSGVWGNITGTLSDQTDLKNALDAKANISSLATVATTGAYSDLSGTPTIGSGTITIKKNGDTVDSFGLNQTADQNINITVPTKTSDLSNDSNFTSKTYVDDGLALKQDVISDLSTIRSGAALGATALQSVPSEYVTDSELATELSAKQDVISDLSDIRSGAAAGATAVQPAAITNMVTTNTNQTITGIKTFSTRVIANSDVEVNLSCDEESQLENREKFKVIDDDESHTLLAVYPGWDSDDSLVQVSSDEFKWQGNTVATTNQLTWDTISSKPTFATVATSGSYTDLSNTPTNLVTTNTQQDITASKTIYGDLRVTDDGDRTIDLIANQTGGLRIEIDDESEISILGAGELTLKNSNGYGATIDVNSSLSSDITLTLPTSTGTLALQSEIPVVPTNYVTTDTTQTITGIKTFSNQITASHGISVGGAYGISGGSYVAADYLTGNYLRANSLLTHTGWFDDETISGDETDYDLKIYANGFEILDDEDVDNDAPYYVGLPKDNGIIALTKNIPTNNNQLTNGAGYQTASDVSTAIASQTKETWTFTLADGTTTTKTIVLG